jgi:hypothetical protein
MVVKQPNPGAGSVWRICRASVKTRLVAWSPCKFKQG